MVASKQNLYSLFRKKRFMLDEMFQQNASKFAIFLEYENPRSFFHFSFRATLVFLLMNALVYVDIKTSAFKTALFWKDFKKLHFFHNLAHCVQVSLGASHLLHKVVNALDQSSRLGFPELRHINMFGKAFAFKNIYIGKVINFVYFFGP